MSNTPASYTLLLYNRRERRREGVTSFALQPPIDRSRYFPQRRRLNAAHPAQTTMSIILTPPGLCRLQCFVPPFLLVSLLARFNLVPSRSKRPRLAFPRFASSTLLSFRALPLTVLYHLRACLFGVSSLPRLVSRSPRFSRLGPPSQCN